MTIKELAEKLQTLPLDKEVYIKVDNTTYSITYLISDWKGDIMIEGNVYD